MNKNKSRKYSKKRCRKNLLYRKRKTKKRSKPRHRTYKRKYLKKNKKYEKGYGRSNPYTKSLKSSESLLHLEIYLLLKRIDHPNGKTELKPDWNQGFKTKGNNVFLE